jgi:hypothetical protein
MIVFDDFLVITQGDTCLVHHMAPCFIDDGVAGGSIPFPDWAQARVDVGTAFRNGAQFQ